MLVPVVAVSDLEINFNVLESISNWWNFMQSCDSHSSDQYDGQQSDWTWSFRLMPGQQQHALQWRRQRRELCHKHLVAVGLGLGYGAFHSGAAIICKPHIKCTFYGNSFSSRCKVCPVHVRVCKWTHHIISRRANYLHCYLFFFSSQYHKRHKLCRR